MTIESGDLRNDYVGNGVAVEFAVTFEFIENDHVKVLLYDAVLEGTVELVENTDYILVQHADRRGTVTTVVPPTADQTLTFLRDLPFEQQHDYVDGDDFPADSHETALDEGICIDQQLAEAIKRCLRLPETGFPPDADISIPPYDPGKAWKWDETEVKIVNSIFNVDEQLLRCIQYAEAAEASAELASEWAQNPEDVPVVPLGFSAFHWSRKAKQFAEEAEEALAKLTVLYTEQPVIAGQQDFFLPFLVDPLTENYYVTVDGITFEKSKMETISETHIRLTPETPFVGGELFAIWSIPFQSAPGIQLQEAGGTPVGSLIHYLGPSTTVPTRHVLASGGQFSREDYEELWTFAQNAGMVITEAEWQALYAVQSSVGFYSDGNGTTSFRVPLLTDFIRCSLIDGEVGDFEEDGIRNITGTFTADSRGGYPTSGAFTQGALHGDGADGGSSTNFTYEFDASDASGVQIADENQPRHIKVRTLIKSESDPAIPEGALFVPPAYDAGKGWMWDETTEVVRTSTRNLETIADDCEFYRDEAEVIKDEAELAALASEASASDSEGFAALAQQWANEAEDVEILPGEFSSYHWSKKAEDFALALNLPVIQPGDEGKYLEVNATEDGYDLVDIPTPPTPPTQVALNKRVAFKDSGPASFTVPADAIGDIHIKAAAGGGGGGGAGDSSGNGIVGVDTVITATGYSMTAYGGPGGKRQGIAGANNRPGNGTGGSANARALRGQGGVGGASAEAAGGQKAPLIGLSKKTQVFDNTGPGTGYEGGGRTVDYSSGNFQMLNKDLTDGQGWVQEDPDNPGFPNWYTDLTRTNGSWGQSQPGLNGGLVVDSVPAVPGEVYTLSIGGGGQGGAGGDNPGIRGEDGWVIIEYQVLVTL